MDRHHNNISKILEELGIETTGFWKKQLTTLPMYQVGVVKASGKLLAHPMLPQLADELSYLASSTGIHLPLVIGGGVQYDLLPAYKNAGKVNGIRVTSKELINQLVPVAMQNQQTVVEALQVAGVDAVAIPPSVISALYHGGEINHDPSSKYALGEKVDTDYVGDIEDVSTKLIVQAIYDNKIPVISHLGVVLGGSGLDDIVNINATTVAKEVIKALQGMKLLLLGDTPVLGADGNIIHAIYSEKEFQQLAKDGVIKGGMITNIKEAYDVLQYLPHGSSVQLTALQKYKGNGNGGSLSTGLLEELLGNGSGTKIDKLFSVTDYPLQVVDKDHVEGMINDSFKPLGKVLVSDYFSIIEGKNPTVYLVNDDWGGAVSYALPGLSGGKEPEYICKLFTDGDYQGLGVARSIIAKVVMQKGSVVWRSSNKNGKALNFYSKVTDHYGGSVAALPGYNVYMIGVPEEMQHEVVENVASIPLTFNEQ